VRRIIIGTRGSSLARRQTELFSEALLAAVPDLHIETVVIQTEGDRRQDVTLDAIGGQGVFVKDIERRLQAREIDIAVHSLKDMPAETPGGLVIGAVLPRADVRDALVARNCLDLESLSPGARIGSDSRRRVVQLKTLRPDIEMVGIRGNVDTRLRKVESGEYDAVVLAAAGLERLGLLERASQVFSIAEVLPAPGQGALAIECREDDEEMRLLLSKVDDQDTRLATEAERGFLQALGSGCSLPVAAHAVVEGDHVKLDALIADDAGKVHRAGAQGQAGAAGRIGYGLAARLRIEARV
jgi:hydroxymethylbilane synthase